METKPLEQEARLTFNVPAIWSNHSAVTSFAPNFIRIAFAEVAPGETKAFQWNAALMMTADSARALRNGLTAQLQQIEKYNQKD